MKLNPPRVGEILAGAFGALLVLSLFLPWYRTAEPATAGCGAGQASCPRETVSGFEALAVTDIVLLAVAIAGVALLLLEMTQRTAAVPLAWSALLAPVALIAFALVLWRTLAPPGGAADEPVFAFLGLVATGGLAIAVLIGMRNEGYGWRARVPRGGGPGGAPGAGLPDPLPVPRATGEGPREGDR